MTLFRPLIAYGTFHSGDVLVYLRHCDHSVIILTDVPFDYLFDR